MTAPFDWAGLWRKTADVFKKHGENIAATTIDDMDRAAANYLRTRIEAAFVPVDQADDHSTCHRDGCSLTGIPYGLASCGCWDTEIRARAEAAEARVKVLEEYLLELENLLVKSIGSVRQALGDEHE